MIAVAHIAAFAFIVPWGDWFAGSLRSGEADLGSVADFWALPGGIVLPTVLTGLLMIRLGRQGQRLGIGFGIALIVWAGFCVFLLGPSGFLGVLVPAGFLIAAAVVDRKA
ncbi:hypothetical protein FAB82_11770 [Glycomyces buryatensis]|uniref:Uncharacterized protein n=1 Tax=Glycomyces buryatensis TaxID=2570927 RepID=A0A4S8QB35_9ACTN|nr:hypothetical protein FAB82_11770 [Glycomyces buryatensis]